MPKIMNEKEIPPEDVFRSGQAYCPEHDMPVILRGMDSGSMGGTTERYVRVRMFCASGSHWLLAEFSALHDEVGLNFKVVYGDRVSRPGSDL